jgi:hypothetical protein
MAEASLKRRLFAREKDKHKLFSAEITMVLAWTTTG